MSGICGWINNRLQLEAAKPVISLMADQLLLNSSQKMQTAVDTMCLIAAAGLPNQTSVFSTQHRIAACHGRPRWKLAELAKIAERRGHAAALSDGYSEHGADIFQYLLGSFSLVIADTQQRRCLIAIDRMGISPLYYSVRNGQLIFGSDARCIKQHPDADRSINNQAIFDYLYFHMVPSPHSIFSSQEKLLPGQYLIFDNENIKKEFYWQPNFSETKHPQNQLEALLREKLNTAVGEALDGSKTGTFLSGGTDSSTIAGLYRQIAASPVDTYSIGFAAEGFDETEYARIAAKHFSLTAHEYYLKPQDVADAIPIIARAYDEPFGNASAVPTYYCAKAARTDGLDTLLAGDGGDELFGGNARYAKQKIFHLYSTIPGTIRHSVLEPLIFNFPLGSKLAPIAKAQSYINQANIPLPERMESYNFLNRFALENIFAGEFLSKINPARPGMNLQEVYRRANASDILNRMLFLDWKITLADNDLRKVNRMCELAGIDVRYPMLNDDLVEFSTHIPPSLMVKHLKLRYFFKKALEEFLPKEILEKSKHGFGLPFGIWMNDYEPLREIANESLAKFSDRGFVQRTFIRQLLNEHRSHPSYYGTMIWVIVMLEQWLSCNQ
ncbi:asparagine synthetase B family protein [Methylocaldum sp.]|uniref:asparagine synthetase B family protein n=1 Tax=Methylocaldum sp. TaxID=1969727 RepID=UPI002D5714E9|nr:asparagine synthase-related protein [Methylocaldum sp.]HYE37073.1 asparagine synthase-related protein [Methylocaldum sp.]